jgi:hypothetical protein
VCILEGTPTPRGNALRMTGTQTCRAGSQSFTRPFLMEDLVANSNGFSAAIVYPDTCGAARIAGARPF